MWRERIPWCPSNFRVSERYELLYLCYVFGHETDIDGRRAAINVTGLRDRKCHRHGHAFVKVLVDNREVYKTDVSLEPTAPTWTYVRPKIL